MSFAMGINLLLYLRAEFQLKIYCTSWDRIDMLMANKKIYLSSWGAVLKVLRKWNCYIISDLSFEFLSIFLVQHKNGVHLILYPGHLVHPSYAPI